MGKLNERYIEKDMKESFKCQAPFANLFFSASLSVKVIGGQMRMMELTKLQGNTGQLIILAYMTGFPENDKVYVAWSWGECLSFFHHQKKCGNFSQRTLLSHR